MEEILSILFPCIAILYLIDSIRHVPQYHVLFVSFLGSKFRLKRSGFHFSDLSPIGCVIVSHNYPVCFTRTGVYLLDAKIGYEIDLHKAEDFSFVSYQDIGEIETDGETVRLGEKYSIKTSSVIASRRLAHIIDEMKDLDSSKRTAKIAAFLSEAFDVQAITDLWSSYSGPFFYLKALCCFLFINTFVLLPLVLYSNLSFFINITFIVIYMILSYLIIVIFTYFKHKKIYGPERLHRAYLLLSVICLPVTTMHVLSYLTRDMYSRFDYLALTAALTPSSSFIALARKEWHRIDYIKSQIKVEDWIKFWDLKKDHLLRLIEITGLSVEDILAVPERQDQTATNYCPYCLCEYTEALTECPDCGIKLKTF